jgi:hypothetical protein
MKFMATTALVLLASAVTGPALAAPITLHLTRASLTNVNDAAGVWQFEGGDAFIGSNLVAHYASSKRVVTGGTDAQNTAMLTLTLFFLSRKAPPQNITLQGDHDFSSGGEIGSVSAASSNFKIHIGKQFVRSGATNTLTIQ